MADMNLQRKCLFQNLFVLLCFVFKVVINGGATSSGDQDTEDTELMAIYTTENGIAEKVCSCILLCKSSLLVLLFVLPAK